MEVHLKMNVYKVHITIMILSMYLEEELKWNVRLLIKGVSRAW